MVVVAPRNAGSWLGGSPDWAWPGRKPAVAVGPASWTPVLPARIELPAARVLRRPRPRTLPRPLRLARLALLLAVAAATFVLSSGLAHSGPPPFAATAPVRLDAALISPFAPAANLLTDTVANSTPALAVLSPALPAPVAISTDAAGSTIASVSYPSAALGWRDRFLVYLPPGYRASAGRRYPVLYLLHGDVQPAGSFLRLGLQPTLDRPIGPPAIKAMNALRLPGPADPPDS